MSDKPCASSGRLRGFRRRRKGIIRAITSSRLMNWCFSAPATCSDDQAIGELAPAGRGRCGTDHARPSSGRAAGWPAASGSATGSGEERDRKHVDQRAGRDHGPAGERHAQHDHVEQHVDRLARATSPNRAHRPAVLAAGTTSRQAKPSSAQHQHGDADRLVQLDRFDLGRPVQGVEIPGQADVGQDQQRDQPVQDRWRRRCSESGSRSSCAAIVLGFNDGLKDATVRAMRPFSARAAERPLNRPRPFAGTFGEPPIFPALI